jgi:hypothetical protein
MFRKAVPVFLMAALVGCASSDPAPSGTAHSSDQPGEHGTPDVTASQTAQPRTASPSASSASNLEASPTSRPRAERYRLDDIVAVTVDGLAVRQGPGTGYTMLAAARWGGDGIQVLGSPYRLAAGEELIVGQGPLAIDGRDWYAVRHTDEEIQWTPPGDPESAIHGWIATIDGAEEFVRLVAEASEPCCFYESGVGPATTAEVATLPAGPPGASRGFVITLGHAEPVGSCHIRVIDESDQVLLDETVVGWGNPGAWWPGEGDRLVIETDCSWSLRVGNFLG